ncbi:MAG: glycosyltransferase, partial [Longimicrobiales bacterium]
MKLCYLINGLGTGGAERSLAELLPFYLDGGIQPTVVCLKSRDIGVEADVRGLGCPVRFLPGGGVLARVRALRKLLRAERFDLLHTTLFDADVVGRLAAMGTGIPVITSVVNTAYDDARLADPNVGRLHLRAAQLIDGLTARALTTHFHAITQAVKDSTVASLGVRAERITVVFRGRSRARLETPDAERRSAVRQHLGLDADAEVILNVGRQEYQKGQQYLLQAVEPLLRSRPRLIVLIAGRAGHAATRLQERHAGSSAADRVWFLGHRTDVPDLLAAAD